MWEILSAIAGTVSAIPVVLAWLRHRRRQRLARGVYDPLRPGYLLASDDEVRVSLRATHYDGHDHLEINILNTNQYKSVQITSVGLAIFESNSYVAWPKGHGREVPFELRPGQTADVSFFVSSVRRAIQGAVNTPTADIYALVRDRKGSEYISTTIQFPVVEVGRSSSDQRQAG